MSQNVAELDRAVRTALVRWLAFLSSPVERKRNRAVRELGPMLGQLEQFVIAGELKERQLRELHRLGSAAVPSIMRMLAELGPNCRDSGAHLIYALREIAGTSAEVLIPYQSELEALVLQIDERGYSFHSDSSVEIGECLGMIGGDVDGFLAENLREHGRCLADSARWTRDEVPLRMIALTCAAKQSRGPASREALLELLDNVHAAGCALLALLEFGETSVMDHLGSEVFRDKASGARLSFLREMLTRRRAEVQPFAESGKAALEAIVREERCHHDVRGTALSVLFRFFFEETLQFVLDEGLAGDGDDEFRVHLVRAAFASDGLLEQRRVEAGDFQPASTTARDGELSVQGQVIYEGNGSELTEAHVQIARQMLALGQSTSASLLFALLGEGITLKEEDVLCVDVITRTSDFNEVSYLPVSLLDAPAEILDQLAALAVEFVENEANQWKSRWDLCFLSHVRDNGVIYALQYLLRIRDVDRIRDLMTSSKQENVKGIVLSLAGSLAGPLKAEYEAALAAEQEEALRGLVYALPNSPEAASIIRRSGVKVLFWSVARASRASAWENPFAEIAKRSPALARVLYEEVVEDEGGVLDLSRVAGNHGSGQNAMEAILRMHEAMGR